MQTINEARLQPDDMVVIMNDPYRDRAAIVRKVEQHEGGYLVAQVELKSGEKVYHALKDLHLVRKAR